MFGGSFAPAGWALCNGALMPISENETLFNLIGTTYGGDGQSTFALPDLQGRIPVHAGTLSGGSTYVQGQIGGAESVTLSTQQIPSHTHVPIADTHGGNTGDPFNATWAESALLLYQQNPSAVVPMKTGALSDAGGSQPHDNMPPYLGINFIISLYGIYPSQN
jgi:microcystin-dependent protein